MVRWTNDHPVWAALDCDDCQTYRTSGGKLVRDKNGLLIPTKSVPLCVRTPCGSREHKPRLRSEWVPLLERYRQWRQLGVLPRPGGLLDQNPIERVVFTELREAERRAEAQAYASPGSDRTMKR